MAGAAGKVLNRSGFSSFVVKDWQSWMTEAVILHASGMSIPELRVRFGRTDQHLRNIMNTSQATEIIRKIAASSIERIEKTSSEKITAIKEKALDAMLEMVSNEELKVTSPFAFWDASRKTAETVTKLDQGPAVSQTTVSQNIQNNFIASPELLASLRNAPTMIPLEVPTNVQYLGSPPPAGSSTQGVLGSGHSELPNQSKNGLTLVSGSSSLPANTKST
jgi:hypothetical protein